MKENFGRRSSNTSECRSSRNTTWTWWKLKKAVAIGAKPELETNHNKTVVAFSLLQRRAGPPRSGSYRDLPILPVFLPLSSRRFIHSAHRVLSLTHSKFKFPH